MAKSILKNISIKGMSVVLGENQRHFSDEPLWWGGNEIQRKKLQSVIGFDSTFVASQSTTTADLCKVASLNLMSALDIECSSIEAIVSITQTPDYEMPNNAHILHKDLGLRKDCIALDLQFGCSGFIYGLYVAGMLINSGLKRILLVAGDTISKCINPKDKATAPIFSDTGSATIIDFNQNAPNCYFILKSDGRGWEHLCKKAGGYKIPSSETTKIEVSDENGNIRSAENLYMNGAEIFNFTLLEQPPLIDEILAFSNLAKEQIDFFVFHQANTYILQTLLKKAQIPLSKAPSIFAKYGNQNSASIPSAICEELSEQFGTSKKVLMQGFGIGLSWGACIMELKNVLCLKPQIYTTTKGENNE